MLDAINVTSRKTIIFECDFFAVLCALVTWQDSLRQSNVVIHTDNDAVRDCFISCHTGSDNALPILDVWLKFESNVESSVWVTRVPTESNIHDDRSRLVVQHLADNGCLRDDVDCQRIWDSMVLQSDKLERGMQLTRQQTPVDKNDTLCAINIEGHQSET